VKNAKKGNKKIHLSSYIFNDTHFYIKIISLLLLLKKRLWPSNSNLTDYSLVYYNKMI